ncbi:MFS transporter [uncultured Nocardioides sp.]|uniref:MFS transporter n=1 Tax=uncultured Nocardioides sp. TaxID=198441 RepID=UPI0026137408|nr:MFS transporter [uncultured Nocardioides sp.]
MTAPTATGVRAYGWPVWAWGLWDWAGAAFNAVITTFVFSVYLTSDAFGPQADSRLGWTLAAAGVVVALTAPVSGQRSDGRGHRTRWLGIHTGLVVICSAALFWVRPDESYLWFGLLALAAGNVFFELAQVNYNAMLPRVSTPATIGRISGLGWGLGYLGGIVLLLAVYLGLISPEVGWFGVTDADGLDVRVTMLVCAAWTLVFAVPVLLTLRDEKVPATRGGPEAGARAGVVESYRRLLRSVADLWRTDRNLVFFLGASAVFRDGLAGVFAFAGVLAAGSFGFSPGDVILLGIAANVVAGIATIGFGFLDDRLGPKRVIVLALVAMVLAGLGIFAFHDAGAAVFWTLGLTLSVFVGPAQSASRTFLARMVPPGREGQVFGLYATTGRAVSFLAPAAFATAITVGAAVTGEGQDAAQHWGVLGIVAVLAAGLALLSGVREVVRLDPPTDTPRPA